MRKTIADLLPNTQYAIRVRAVAGKETSDWSNRLLFTTVSDTTPISTPTGLTWAVNGDAFHAEWNPVTTNINGDIVSVARYDVQLIANSVTKVISVVPVDSSSKVVYDLTFLSNQALFGIAKPTVQIAVRAVDIHGIVSSYTSLLSATNPAPGPPTGANTVAGVDSLDISWTAPSDDDLIGYNVYVGTTSGFTPSVSNLIWSGNATRFTYTSTTYSLQYFKIRAVDKFNQESTDALTSGTPTSPFIVDITAPSTPTGLSATITTSTSTSLETFATVSWTANTEPDLAGYFLRYRKSSETNWTVIRIDKAATDIIVRNLIPYTNYQFQISAVDFTDNQSSYSSTVTGTGATNTAPSTPTAPTVAANTMQAQVVIPGTKSTGGAMEADVSFYEVYGSTVTGFTPGTANMLGVIPTGPAMVQTFQIPSSGSGLTQTWFFKIIAVDNGGLKSNASAQTTATPGLIQSTNITDATITNAKISDLAADKIVAGNGFINNLNINATLTVGDASTNGSIQSFDYVSGTTGYKMASVGGTASLEINQGVIRAPALVIQKSGTNIMKSPYADFEANSGFYSSTNLTVTNSTALQNTTFKKFNTASLAYAPSNTTNSVFLGRTNTDYNINVQPDTDYIISFYAMVPTGGTATTLTTSLKYQTASSPGTLSLSGQAIAANSTWARYSGVVTVPSTATGGAILSLSTNTATGTVYIDGIQIEEKMSSATTPSAWAPPGATTIDGYQIKTGSLISSTNTTVNGNSIPWWSINESGSASFANLQVRGNAIVGVAAGTDGGASSLASGNYVSGTSGWKIKSDGTAEFTAGAAALTFTGGVFQTAANTGPGHQGMIMSADTSGGVIKFWSGISGESAGFINPFTVASTIPILMVSSGSSPSMAFPVEIELWPGIVANAGSLNVNNGYINMNNVAWVTYAGASGMELKLNKVTFFNNSGYQPGDNANASNTQDIHAREVHSWSGGIWLEDLGGGSATTAQIGASGRIVRATLGSYTTSTKAVKTNIEDMTYDQAKSTLALRSRTYQDKERVEKGEDCPRLPGFIAEEAADAGLDLWVGLHDTTGEPHGFRYAELVVAHNLLIKDLYDQIENLQNQITQLS